MNDQDFRKNFIQMKQTYFINQGNLNATFEAILNEMSDYIAEKDDMIQSLQNEIKKLTTNPTEVKPKDI